MYRASPPPSRFAPPRHTFFIIADSSSVAPPRRPITLSQPRAPDIPPPPLLLRPSSCIVTTSHQLARAMRKEPTPLHTAYTHAERTIIACSQRYHSARLCVVVTTAVKAAIVATVALNKTARRRGREMCRPQDCSD